MKKIFVLIFTYLLFINCIIEQFPIASRIDRKNFTLVVQIDNLSRNNVGCGIIRYTICKIGIVENQLDKVLFGKKVKLYFVCPETLNGLPYGNKYNLEVELRKEIIGNENIICSSTNDSLVYTHLNVIRVNAVF